MVLTDAVVPVEDAGLGNCAYVLSLGGGRAALVDPSRDLRAVREVLRSRGLTVSHALETHLHADFLSAARPLRSEGVTIGASAEGRRLFAHQGLHDGDRLTFGTLSVKVLATPGHSPDHVAYLLLEGDDPVAVFTGGSLLVGGAARTDLHGEDRTVELARSQFRSLQRFRSLPDAVVVYPTHGSGSFCSAPVGSARMSTIGRERITNALFAEEDEDAFVDRLLGSLGSYPTYFGRLPEANRRGASVMRADPVLESLEPGAAELLIASGALVVDVRQRERFARGHIPGSLSIPLRPAFASWLGWLVPEAETPIIVVRDADQDGSDAVWQARKIGYETLVGEVSDGLNGWNESGRATACIPLLDASEMVGATLLDVRQAAEYDAGHVPGALNIELGQLPAQAPDLVAEDVIVMCAVGDRAASAASILARAGSRTVRFVAGGPEEWVASGEGRVLVTGDESGQPLLS